MGRVGVVAVTDDLDDRRRQAVFQDFQPQPRGNLALDRGLPPKETQKGREHDSSSMVAEARRGHQGLSEGPWCGIAVAARERPTFVSVRRVALPEAEYAAKCRHQTKTA